MKLLLDQNISFRAVSKLKNDFPGIQHIRLIGFENSTDQNIWEFAKSENFTIVTFDSDFFDLANLRGIPPKIIWLRTGNMTTENIVQILTKSKDSIFSFINGELYKDVACLEIE